MKTIKEKVWKRATTELNYDDTKRNFEYEEPIIDLTLSEVEKVINEVTKKELDYVLCYGLKKDLTKKEEESFKNIFKTLYTDKLKLRLRGK